MSYDATAVARAFTEWERRFREEPDRFLCESAKAAESAESYGEACAPYFLQILGETSVVTAA